MKNATMSRAKLAPKEGACNSFKLCFSIWKQKIEGAPTIEPKDLIRKTILNTECGNWSDLGMENIIYEIEFNFKLFSKAFFGLNFMVNETRVVVRLELLQTVLELARDSCVDD